MKYISAVETSLWSLRRFYHGPITLFSTPEFDSQIDSLAKRFSTQKRVIPHYNREIATKARIEPAHDYGLFPHFVNKLLCNLESPYQRTIFLDADTLVEAPLDPLFDNELAFTMFTPGSEPILLGGKHHRSARYRKYFSRLARQARNLKNIVTRTFAKNPILVNSGVYVFSPENPFMQEWLDLAVECAAYGIPDQTALHLAMANSSEEFHLLPDQWNAKAHRTSSWSSPKKVRHYGSGWENYPSWRRAYLEMQRECFQ